MRIIVLSTIFPNQKSENEFLVHSKGSIPSTGSEVQKSLIRGMEKLYKKNILIINAEPIGTWPNHYNKLLLSNKKNRLFEKTKVLTIGCINLPIIKQVYRYKKTYQYLRDIIKRIGNKEKIEILMYHFYQPHMLAALKAKKYGNVRINVIVPDLPNEYGIGYNISNPIKRFIHNRMGKRELALAKKMDRYILFTKDMKEPLELKKKPYIVMEGVCSDKYLQKYADYKESNPVSFLYSGNLCNDCGIKELLDVFSKVDKNKAVLNLYGFGPEVDMCKRYANKYPSIVYHNPVSAEELCKAQQQATYLINPRKNDGKATRYFFPSKTFGYMASGRPMIAYWLDCFPDEYKGLFYTIDPNDPKGLEKAVNCAIAIPESERMNMGKSAQRFVASQKDENSQAKKVLGFLLK